MDRMRLIDGSYLRRAAAQPSRESVHERGLERPARLEEIQVSSKPNPNPAKSGPHPAKPSQILARESFDFLCRIEPFQGLAPTPRAFFISCAASRLEGGHGRRRRCLFAWVRSVSWSSFRVRPCLSSEVKGWRLFHDRGRSGVFVRLGGRGADEREKGTPRSTDPRGRDRDLAEKGRPIDPMSGKKFARKRREPVSSLWNSGRAAALHAASVS